MVPRAFALKGVTLRWCHGVTEAHTMDMLSPRLEKIQSLQS